MPLTKQGKSGRGTSGSKSRHGSAKQLPYLTIPSTCVANGLGLNSRQAPFRTIVAILATQAGRGATEGRSFNNIAFENQAPLSTTALDVLFGSLEARGQLDRAAHARILSRLRTLPSGRVALKGPRGYLCCTDTGAGWVSEYSQRREEEWELAHIDGAGWTLRGCNAQYLGQRALVDSTLTVTVSDAVPSAVVCVFVEGDSASGSAAGTVLRIAGEHYEVEPTPPGVVELEGDWARSWGAALAHCCVGADAGCALELLLAIYATNTQWERKAAASALVSDAAQAEEEDAIHAVGLDMIEALGGARDAELGAALEQLDKSKVKFTMAQRTVPRGKGRYTYSIVGRADGAFSIGGTTVISDAKCSAFLSDDALLQVMVYAHIYGTDFAFCVARHDASDSGEAPLGSELLWQRLYAVDVTTPHVSSYLREELLGGMDRLVSALRDRAPKAYLAGFLSPAELRCREQAFLTFVQHCPPVDLGKLGGVFEEHTEQRVAAFARAGTAATAGDCPWAAQCVRAPRHAFLRTLRRRHLPFFVSAQAIPPVPARAAGVA